MYEYISFRIFHRNGGLFECTGDSLIIHSSAIHLPMQSHIFMSFFRSVLLFFIYLMNFCCDSFFSTHIPISLLIIRFEFFCYSFIKFFWHHSFSCLFHSLFLLFICSILILLYFHSFSSVPLLQARWEIRCD